MIAIGILLVRMLCDCFKSRPQLEAEILAFYRPSRAHGLSTNKIRSNRFIEAWLRMQEDEIREQAQTIAEVIERIDMGDERTAKRVESKEYQPILRKTLREWAGAESEDKRKLLRNILANAAASTV